MSIILDTCSLIWIIAQPDKLSQKAKNALTDPAAIIYVSAISCGELACAVERNRVKLDRHWKRWFRHYLNLNEWECLPIDLDVMEEAYSLPEPFHADPADRIITATARLKGLSIATPDEKITQYPHVNVLW